MAERLRPLLQEPVPASVSVISSSPPGTNRRAPVAGSKKTARSVNDTVASLPLRLPNDTVVGVVHVLRRGLQRDSFQTVVPMLEMLADQTAVAVSSTQLAASLAKERRSIESILEMSADGIMTLSPDRRILSFSGGMERITGCTKAQAVGRQCFEVINMRDDRGADLCRLACPLEKGVEGFANMTGVIVSRDGKSVDVGMSYSAPRTGEGETPTIVVNVRDIGFLREVDALRDSILSTVSHELQTPISIIKAYASTLARPDAQWSPETIVDKLNVIEEESDRLAGLVGKLLLSSRLETGRFSLNKSHLDLAKEAHRATRRFTDTGASHPISIQCADDLPPVLADQESIAEVLSNLISNAIKFSPERSLITVRCTAAGNTVSVAVIDEGVGIPPEEQGRVFDRFYKVEDAGAHASQGTGLGLYICKMLVETQGGRIEVQSEPGKGCCFTFTLPAAWQQDGA